MTCEHVRHLLHAYLDDELDLVTALAIEEHLQTCHACPEQLEAAREIRLAVAQPALYAPAPVEFRHRLIQQIRAENGSKLFKPNPPRWKSRLWFPAIAAAIALVLVLAKLLIPSVSARPEVAELVDSHVRSLEGNHLLDVESTDQHTVKPWFNGRLDFSPPVVDLSAEGFPLAGGRLDYLLHQNVAALIFRRNKHIINLYIWPGHTDPANDLVQGFNLMRFDCKGMVCWAVSDLNTAELRQFVNLFQGQKAASTRF